MKIRDVVFLWVFLVAGCTRDKAVVIPTEAFVCDSTVTYTTAIKSIMDSRCGLPTCHDIGTPGGGFNLTTYRDCKDIALTHDVLLCTVKHDTCGYKPMPYPMGSPKLSDSLINIISCWVENGAK
jgi:hypothetical protein